jgi:urease accessory protein
MNQSLTATPAESSSPLRRWPARLDLVFRPGLGRTVLAHALHQGPLRVQRLFHPEPCGKAHCYLLHPPGGVVLGDELEIRASVDGAAALLTTPSAGRFYSIGSFTEEQWQRVHLTARGGRLEWLPQETLLFPGARARLHTHIDLHDAAELAYWDILVLGRPACGEPFLRGSLEQKLSIESDGRPLLRERIELSAGDRLSRSPLGLAGASTLGLAVFTGSTDEEAQGAWLRDVNGPGGEGEFSLTQRGSLLLARYRGEDAQRCRVGFSRLWRRVMLDTTGREPEEPRIWHT